PMLEDLLAGLLQSSPDLKIARVSTAGDLTAAASAAKAEAVVVVHQDPADLVEIDPVLGRAANLSILALAPDGASGYLHRIRCETSRIADVTPDAILRALAPNPVR